MRTITIKPALNGYLVTVGCQTLVFNSIETVANELIRYASKPEEVEQEYMKKHSHKLCQPEAQPYTTEGAAIGRVTDVANIARALSSGDQAR